MSNDSPTVGTSSTPADTGAATPAATTVAPAAAAPIDPTTAPVAAPVASTTTAPADPAATPAAAPEYTDFAAPEGVKLDDAIVGEFKAFAKEKNISQEDAQKFVDMGAKIAQKTQAAYMEQMEQAQAKWVSDSRADKEFGGDKLNENLAIAKKALDTFGGEELTKLLQESGLGNHPEIIRYNFRVAQAISEDRLVPGGAKPANTPSAQNFYSKSGMNP